jgi:AcrR family transcriptional regulator
VAEHVAAQEAAVVDAAASLFARRGASSVTMADIAAEVGLARNSLYRYFPDKSHILATWFRRELEPLAERSNEIARGDDAALAKLHGWIDLQLDYLRAPEHRQMIEVMTELATLEDPVRSAVADGHEALYASVTGIIEAVLAAEDTAPGRDSGVLTSLVAGLLRSAMNLDDSGADPEMVRLEVHRAVEALLRSKL